MTPEPSRSSSSESERRGSPQSESVESKRASAELRGNGRERSVRSREELEQSIEATREEIRHRMESLRRELALPRLRVIERIEDHPEIAVGVAAAAGVLAGRLLGRPRPTDTDGDAHRRLLVHVLREARSRSEGGTLDEEAIEEIAETYASALDRVAAQRDRGGGLLGGMWGELAPLLLRRVAREAADRIVPALLEAVRPTPPEEG